MQEQDPEKEEIVRRELNSYVRYSGIGFQMIAVIGIFMFIGYKIDQSRQSDKLLFTAILGMVGVGASLYLVIRSLKNKRP